jgi:hypothetical protein
MINKESNQTKENSPKPDDTSKVDVLAHIVIKDVATGKVIVDKRG